MSTPSGQLDNETHARVFAEQVLTENMPDTITSQTKPRAIILAGQPGAGKGGLSGAAKSELNKDVVTIDPDELRKYHPDVDTFRKAHPYTWSGQTHADASKWADELLDATVASKKNLIFDTTLSNGQWGSELIKDLQARGYEVEVRAVAAHRLESELGVDERFTRDIDKKGYGRHVPEGARDAIYSKLPGSLDTIHAQNDVSIRLFSREGAELYNSRTDTRLPSAALEEAREARVKDPNITRGLRDGWKEQQMWHRELPETLPQNSNVDPLTRENLLTERRTGNVVDGIERGTKEAVDIDHVTRVQPTRIKAGGALGIAGLALDAYDAAETYRTVSRHRAQGNDTAADSEMMHFGSRTVGAWSGAAIGMGAGALAGVETGPGLLVTGAIGGIAGVFLGDEFAKWTDDRRIYNQNDRQGNTWTYDPDRPDLSWQRKAQIDARDDGIDNPSRGIMRASPVMAAELNFKSTSTSVELILGSPPVPRDPFAIPADKGDTPSFSRADWMRDVENGQWQREVVLAFAERGMSPKRLEIADPQRSAELDRTSAEIVLQNSANSPAAIAARYEAVYAQNNWSAFGDMPEAVRKARTDVDSLIASDGNLYRRQNDGEWISKGAIYDSTASGALRAELDTTREVLQATLPPPQALQAPALMTADERLRDTIQGAYANAGVTPSAELLDAGVAAVKQTHVAQGLDSSTTALQLQPGPDGRYGAESPIASLRLDNDGTYRIMAVTTAPDVHRGAQEQAPLLMPQNPSSRSKTEDVHDQTPGTSNPDKSAQLNHPGNSHHPFHSIFRQATAHVEKQDEKLGRTPDEKSERLALAATALAADSGMTRIDHMVFSAEDKARGLKAGENVIVVQGGLNDAAHDRAHMKTEVAINMPIEQSLKQMDVIHQQQNQQEQAMAMQRSQAPDHHSPVQRIA